MVPAVLIVTALNGSGAIDVVLLGTLKSIGIVAGFIFVSWAFSKWAMPTIVRLVAPSRNREMPILFAFIAAMGSAWAAQELGLSAALGAFIAAVFLGESALASQLRADLGPFKSVFVTLFFASIGMLFDPAWAMNNLGLLLAVTAAVVVLKPVMVSVVGLIMQLQVRHAVASGVCLCQIGVFSFVLADVARMDPGGGVEPLFGQGLFNLVVAVTILALFFTPYGVGLARPAGAWVERAARRRGLTKKSGEKLEDLDTSGSRGSASKDGGHVIIVGFGPAGRAVADAVKATGVDVVVSDLNPRSVLAAREQGLRAFVGDASQGDILKLLGVYTASALVVTLPDHRLTVAVIIEARGMNPALTVIARARYHRYADLIKAAGAHAVINEEAEVGIRLGEQLVSVPVQQMMDRSDVTKVDWLAGGVPEDAKRPPGG